MRKNVAAVNQRLVASKNWLGSESVNVLQVLCDLLDLVQQMNVQLASHTHGTTPIPNNASVFSENLTLASSLYAKLQSVTL